VAGAEVADWALEPLAVTGAQEKLQLEAQVVTELQGLRQVRIPVRAVEVEAEEADPRVH
jgi:hypothetical protein